MKPVLLILVASLLAGCSQANSALQSAEALLVPSPAAQAAATATTGTGTPPANLQAYSTNSPNMPATAGNFGWSTNIKGNPPVIITTTTVVAPANTATNTISYPGSGNIPAMSTSPTGTIINPTTTTPGANISPTGTVILPATGQ